jgi:Domain of unknown function (DUF4395)
MNTILRFGDRIEGCPVPVLNERAVRAGAGILFVFAIVAFMNAWLTGNFQPTRVFVVAFLVDFTIRILANPRYAPSLILGQWAVRRQQPEWVGAPQKRFAWAIGVVLAASMLYLVVIQNVVGPVNVLVCAACLVLLFFEAAFGICIGCKVYGLLSGQPAQLCPGGTCEVPAAQRPRFEALQLGVVASFAALMIAVAPQVAGPGPVRVAAAQASANAAAGTIDPAEAERCKVPDFAKAIGHEEKWKLHNNCP